MTYLYQNDARVCLLVLSLCIIVQSLFILRGKGQRAALVMLYIVGFGALGLGMASSQLSPTHSASAGSAYALLGGIVACMIPATKRVAKLAAKNPEPSSN
ncbi:MAG: hypothetical protein JST05_09330 [Acidobacteria bacterium]|nr:hypothetical protein [Acidobacteriota bacterium]